MCACAQATAGGAACPHSVHFAHRRYFRRRRSVATFEYAPVLLMSVVTPSTTPPAEDLVAQVLAAHLRPTAPHLTWNGVASAQSMETMARFELASYREAGEGIFEVLLLILDALSAHDVGPTPPGAVDAKVSRRSRVTITPLPALVLPLRFVHADSGRVPARDDGGVGSRIGRVCASACHFTWLRCASLVRACA